MNNNLSVLLIEDDPIERQALSDCITACPNMTLVASTGSSNDGLRLVEESLPKIIILDLELHLGSGNGITFLRDLKNLTLSSSPFILVTTYNNSSATYEFVRQNGADFIISKHQADYSAPTVVNFLLMMTDTIVSKSEGSMSTQFLYKGDEQPKSSILKRIQTELNQIGVTPKSVGYKYLVDAIELVIGGVQHNYCALIGEKYNKTNASVERAMQNAINRTWRNSDIDVLEQHYKAHLSVSRGVPTHTEFVHYYAHEIGIDYL